MPKRDKILIKAKMDEFIRLLPLNTWNISKVCTALGIERTLYYQWIKDSEFLELFNNAMEARTDKVEQNLVDQSDKNVTAAIFYLKNKAKDRGYSDDINFNIDKEIVINVVKK